MLIFMIIVIVISLILLFFFAKKTDPTQDNFDYSQPYSSTTSSYDSSQIMISDVLMNVAQMMIRAQTQVVVIIAAIMIRKSLYPMRGKGYKIN